MQIPQMSLREYAALQTRLGVKVVERDGCFWRQVRPFFFRLLLPVEACPGSAIRPPAAWPSGFQYVTADQSQANSTMNFIMLDEPQGYSLGNLNHKRRQLIKRAAQQFEVRPLTDAGEVKRQGHHVYLSFFQRSGYRYKSDRQKKSVYDEWVDTLFSSPGSILLGGYGPSGLVGISSSFWINHTLVYSTLMCETGAMKLNLGELLFHEVQQLAARHPGIREIFVRRYQQGNSLDRYYLLRGCKLVKKPARLELSAPIRSFIRWTMPRQYDLLCGRE